MDSVCAVRNVELDINVTIKVRIWCNREAAIIVRCNGCVSIDSQIASSQVIALNIRRLRKKLLLAECNRTVFINAVSQITRYWRIIDWQYIHIDDGINFCSIFISNGHIKLNLSVKVLVWREAARAIIVNGENAIRTIVTNANKLYIAFHIRGIQQHLRLTKRQN